jgi:hypothetical protein
MVTAAIVERLVEKLQDVEERIVKNIRAALRQDAGVADPANLDLLATRRCTKTLNQLIILL